MGWFKQNNESEEEKELWREYDYWNYRYDTAKTNEDVCKAYHCKTLRESKMIFESLVNSKYSGEIVVDYIRIVNKKTGEVIEED